MGAFDKYSNKPDNAPFIGVSFGFGNPVLEVELNEAQQIQHNNMVSLLGIHGDCVINRDGFSYDGTTLTLNTKVVKDGIIIDTNGATLALANGESVYISSEIVDYTYQDTIRANGNTAGAVIENTIKDDRLSIECTRRKGYKFTLNKESGMLIGTIVDNNFVCLAPDYFSGIHRYITDNASAPSKKGRVKVNRLYGKSEQKQYRGKNLLVYPYADNTKAPYTTNGITYTVDNEWIVINGTATSNAHFDTYKGSFLQGLQEGKTYTLSIEVQNGTASAYFATSNGSVNTDLVVIGDVSNTIMSKSFIYVRADDTVRDMSGVYTRASHGTHKDTKIRVWLEEGDTATEFEPYVGGIPSPSLEYPQEIKSVSSPVVMCSGKNLINTEAFESTVNGVTWKLDDNHITASGTPTAESFSDSTIFINNKKSGKYTLSLQGTTTNVVTMIAFVNSNDETVDTLTGNEITFDIADYEYAKCFYVQFNSVENDVEVKCDAYLQLEYGDTKTEYAPHSGYFASLPYDLNAIPVESGGNVTIDGQQYIADYVDFEKKQLVKMNYEVDLGTLNWTFWSAEKDGVVYKRFNAELPFKIITTYTVWSDLFLCTSYKHTKDIQSATPTENGASLINTSENSHRIVIHDSSYYNATIEEFKLSMDGVKLLYSIKTPIEINLTDDEIEAFAQFYSQCPVTNIFAASVNSDQNPILDFEVSTTETGAKSLQNENTCTELMGRVNTVAKEVTSRTKIVVSETEPDDKSVVWVQ